MEIKIESWSIQPVVAFISYKRRVRTMLAVLLDEVGVKKGNGGSEERVLMDV